ncbi:hypothetical protein DPMN_037456 [Dreissena polymorpha]|uniref:Uncharacterized protein n=1 Tax=Dreissena polymorpha TaxID=45954 RepID=A0A9D4RMV5_DREPO|nr:hypothetical protein DPMN_037456 [Dreissena polymorpha]
MDRLVFQLTCSTSGGSIWTGWYSNSPAVHLEAAYGQAGIPTHLQYIWRQHMDRLVFQLTCSTSGGSIWTGWYSNSPALHLEAAYGQVGIPTHLQYIWRQHNDRRWLGTFLGG